MKRGEQTEAGKKAISIAMKKRWKEGCYNFMYGETNPSKIPENAKKIGDANKKRVVKQSTKDKIAKARRGKPGNPVSEERKKAYSDRMKIDNPMFRKDVLEKHPVLTSGKTYTSMGEHFLINLFLSLGIKFQHQKKIKKDKGYYTVDFFFPNEKKIIEFDGYSSHINSEEDKIRDLYMLSTYKYQTLRLLPKELNNTFRKILLLKINKFLGI